MHVLGISGSLRSGSFNTALLRAAAEEAPDGVAVDIVTLHGIPMYNRDDERAHGFPDIVAEIRDKVAAADGLVLATPEYNYSVSGVLKNAWDWLSRAPDPPIDEKPLAILGAGGRSGTLRAQLHMRQIALHNQLRVVLSPQVMVRIGDGSFDDTPELVSDRHRDQIRRLMESLVDEAGRRVG